jgi:hypothetical protein
MMIVVDMLSRVVGDNSFYIAIPSEVTVKDSSYSHYIHGRSSSGYCWKNCGSFDITVNGTTISSLRHNVTCGEFARYYNYYLTLDQKNTIKLSKYCGLKSGVGWVLIYKT